MVPPPLHNFVLYLPPDILLLHNPLYALHDHCSWHEAISQSKSKAYELSENEGKEFANVTNRLCLLCAWTLTEAQSGAQL